jgi:hypothetical protein
MGSVVTDAAIVCLIGILGGAMDRQTGEKISHQTKHPVSLSNKSLVCLANGSNTTLLELPE